MNATGVPGDLPDEDESDEVAVGSDLDELEAKFNWLPAFASLDEALRDQGIPIENHDIIRRAVDFVGIERYYPISSRTYIRAVRYDRKPSLKIGFGWTSGFDSEEELLVAVGDVDRWRSGRVWGIWHPVNRQRDESSQVFSGARRDYGICPVDFFALPASGICDHCGYRAGDS